MMDREPFVAAPEERIVPITTRSARGVRGAWAALASLLFHGTALAAVLIAASGEGPRIPPPSIEVTFVVVAGTPPPGSATASAVESGEREPPRARLTEDVGEAREAVQVASESGPVDDVSETDVTEEFADAKPTQPPEPAPPAVAEIAPVLVSAPPPPARKPNPPRPADRSQTQAEPSANAQAEPQPRSQEPSATAAQLAALPDGDGLDTTSAPGVDTAVPPRYRAGGETNPWPRYPLAARRRGLEGEVLLRISVNADGTAEKVEVLRSSGQPLLDRAAMEALARWRFEPAQAAGQPVAGTIEIPVTFRLTDPKGS